MMSSALPQSAHRAATFHPYVFSDLHHVPKTNADLRWTCDDCKTTSNISLSSCRRCGRGGRSERTTPRVFLGQLPKDRTAELADWLVSFALPTVDIYHIEAHTTKDGRSKGCAWVYVNDTEAASKIIELNRKVLFDIDDQGMVGAFTGSEEYLASLCHDGVERDLNMPRQPLVAELPAADQRRKKQVATSCPAPDQQPKQRSPQPQLNWWKHNPYGFNPIPVEYHGVRAIPVQ